MYFMFSLIAEENIRRNIFVRRVLRPILGKKKVQRRLSQESRAILTPQTLHPSFPYFPAPARGGGAHIFRERKVVRVSPAGSLTP